MRLISPALLERIKNGCGTLATCIEITTKSGQVFRLTDREAGIGLYKGGALKRPFAMESTTAGAADNMTCDCYTTDELNRADIDAGLLTDASVRAFVVDYMLPNELLAARLGFIGNVRTHLSGHEFSFDVLGLAEKLNGTLTEQYSPTCRARLGDKRCKKDLGPFTVLGTVAGIDTSGMVISDYSRTEATDWFKYGWVEWLTGANTGRKQEIRASAVGELTLTQQMPRPVAVGDTYKAIAGCDGSLNACAVKFVNVVNRRAEDYVRTKESLATAEDEQARLIRLEQIKKDGG